MISRRQGKIILALLFFISLFLIFLLLPLFFKSPTGRFGITECLVPVPQECEHAAKEDIIFQECACSELRQFFGHVSLLFLALAIGLYLIDITFFPGR